MPAYTPKPAGDPAILFRGLFFLSMMLVFFVIFFLSLSVVTNNVSIEGDSTSDNPYSEVIESLKDFFSFSKLTPGINNQSNGTSSEYSSLDKEYLPVTDGNSFSVMLSVIKSIISLSTTILIVYSPYILLLVIFVLILCGIFFKSVMRKLINFHIIGLHSKKHHISLKLIDLKNHPHRYGLAQGIYDIRIHRLDAQLRIIQAELEEYHVLLTRFDKKKVKQVTNIKQ